MRSCEQVKFVGEILMILPRIFFAKLYVWDFQLFKCLLEQLH